MRFVTFLLPILFQAILHSQAVVTKSNAPKSTLQLFQKGVELYQTNQYEKALGYFQKSLQKTPKFIDAELKWASVCFEMKEFACAEKHFQSVLKLDSTFNLKVYYTLSLTQYELDHFSDSKENMKKYLSRDSSNHDLIFKAKKLLPNISFADSATKHPVPISPVYLNALNTEYKEYLPTISADGKTCVFTRRTTRGDEDLFISHYIDSNWTEPMPIIELNTPAHEGAPALSQDGNTLVYMICDRIYSYGGCDLYSSELINGEWSQPVNMGDKINSPAFESQACFAENGNAIYFTSNRKGTYGGYDIWVSRRKKDHSWSTPKNLGPTINTPGDEQCPFVHPNGSVLYFSSDFPPGMGERDLFYSIMDEKGNWQKPINLGYPINSKGSESSFVVFPDGQKAWMASNLRNLQKKDINERSNLDLYELDLPTYLRVKSSTYVEITVSDKLTDKPINATISIFDLSNNKSFYNGEMNASGKLLIALPTGADYGLHIYNENYVFVPDQFNCSTPKKKYEPLIIHKKLERISSGTNPPVSLKNIFFESGSAVLKKESEFELNTLLQFLQDHSNIKLKITGHTDNIGSDSDNQLLSEKRAGAVVNYLTQKGIAIERLQTEGKGESMPIDNNETEEGRQNNRRIEFTILGD